MKAGDAYRIAALVAAIERLQKGERTTIGNLAADIFGWSNDRVFKAIDDALARKLISRGPPGSMGGG